MSGPSRERQHPPLFLNPRYKVAVQDGVPVLDGPDGPPAHRLALGSAVALELVGGLGGAEDALCAWPAFLGDGAAWIDHAIDRFWSYLDGAAPRPIRFDWLEQIDTSQTTTPSGRQADAAPHALVWLTTLGCNRACPYCFYDVLPWTAGHPADATWSKEAVLRTLDEMKLIGASHLYLTGGEPLLRPDVLDVMEHASDRRVRSHITTRLRIDRSTAARLAAMELGSFTYSLDAGTHKLADALCGCRGFFEEACTSLDHLASAGVPVTVNAVATRPNMGHFDDLAWLLCDLGIPRLEISPYVPPVTERMAAAALVPEGGETALMVEIAELAGNYEGQIDISLGASGAIPAETATGRQNVCEVGFSELHVLPDGKVTRCRYLPRELSLVVGSLETQTICEIWEGFALRSLNAPARSDYAGTSCESCGGFGACNTRGRCYVSAIAKSGTLFAPDQFCVSS